MDENAVVDSVCARLEALGCKVTQRLTTIEKGVDITAYDPKGGQQYFIEAKGGTSSRKNSPRYGRPYSQPQVFDRVAKGVFTCLRLREEHPDREKEHIILAVPDTSQFRSYLSLVNGQLEAAGIEVWFEPVPASVFGC
jgi:hypothetical protein